MTVEDNRWQPAFTGILLFWNSPCKALKCVWSLSCYTPSPQRCKTEGGACLYRMEWHFSLIRVESIWCTCTTPHGAKQTPGLHYCVWLWVLRHYSIILHCWSPYIHYPLLPQISNLDLAVKWTLFFSSIVKYWHFLAHAKTFPQWELVKKSPLCL